MFVCEHVCVYACLCVGMHVCGYLFLRVHDSSMLVCGVTCLHPVAVVHDLAICYCVRCLCVRVLCVFLCVLPAYTQLLLLMTVPFVIARSIFCLSTPCSTYLLVLIIIIIDEPTLHEPTCACERCSRGRENMSCASSSKYMPHEIARVARPARVQVEHSP